MAMPRMLLILFTTVTLSAQEPQANKEAALGAQLANDIRAHTTAVDSPAVQSYVDVIGQKLAKQFPSDDVTYRFTVVTDSLGGRTHEPAALPGGYVFVSTSLLSEARDEAEFAGMLAHAVAHIADRDNVGKARGGQVIHPASVPLVFLGGWNGVWASDMAIPGPFVNAQRKYELEADQQAVRAMASAAYDPVALLRYIDRVQPVQSSLPPRSDRIAALEKAIAELPVQSYSSPKEDFKHIQFEHIQEEVRRWEPSAPTLRRVPPTLLRPE